MAAEVQTGMDKQDMKRLLMKSKKEPVNCAIGMGADPSIGLLLLDRIKGPKAVEKELQKEIPEAKNTRFGTALVDVDDDPKLVKISLNKPVSSMARKLVKTLKGTGFTKVQILLEDGTPVEAFEEEDQSAPAPAAAAPPPPPPPPQAAAKPDAAALAQRLAELVKRMPAVVAAVPDQKGALTKLATDANVQIKTNNLVYAGTTIEQLSRALDAAAAAAAAAAASASQAQTAAPPPPAPPPPPQAAAKPDAAALTQRLAELLKRMPAVITAVPAQKDALTKLATDANVQIKTNNLVYAGVSIEQLSRALDAAAAAVPAAPPAPPAGAAPPAAGAVAYAKSRLAWLAARKKVESDIEKLRGEIVATYSEDGMAADLDKAYRERVAPVLATLDESLADKLDEATNATDAATRAALVAEAKAIMQGYEQYLAGEKIIADLDANPFVPLAIQQTISGTLSTLQKTVR